MKHSNDGWDLCLCVWGTRSTPWIPPWHCCGRPWMIYNHPRSLRGFAWDSGMIFFDRWVWEWVRCFWKGHGQTTKRWVLWHRRFLAELQHVLVILTSRCYPQITKKRGVCVFFFSDGLDQLFPRSVAWVSNGNWLHLVWAHKPECPNHPNHSCKPGSVVQYETHILQGTSRLRRWIDSEQS